MLYCCLSQNQSNFSQSQLFLIQNLSLKKSLRFDSFKSTIQLLKISKNKGKRFFQGLCQLLRDFLASFTRRNYSIPRYTIKQHRGVCRHLHRGVQYPLRSKGCFANPVVSFRFEYPLKLGLTSEQINSGLTLALFDWWHANRQENFVVTRESKIIEIEVKSRLKIKQ